MTTAQEQHLRELAAEAEKAEGVTDTFTALRELHKAVLEATSPKPNDIGYRVAALIASRNSGYTSVHRLAVAEAINIQRADAAKAERERIIGIVLDEADEHFRMSFKAVGDAMKWLAERLAKEVPCDAADSAEART